MIDPRAHDIAEQIEQPIRAALLKSTVFSHLEPKEDAAPYDDQDLERLSPVGQPNTTTR
jgi:predicted class III extradiol MEMO1 family dioxygenase